MKVQQIHKDVTAFLLCDSSKRAKGAERKPFAFVLSQLRNEFVAPRGALFVWVVLLRLEHDLIKVLGFDFAKSGTSEVRKNNIVQELS